MVRVDGALRAEACGPVTAVFEGQREADAPAAYGVERLVFRFGDGVEVPYRPAEPLAFSDWGFDVFSPDCGWVALPAGHYGPYHLVPLAELKAYLRGEASPVVLRARTEPASVHSDGCWVGPDVWEFVASCCGGARVLRGRVTGEVSTVFEAAEAPRGVRRSAGGVWEAVP